MTNLLVPNVTITEVTESMNTPSTTNVVVGVIWTSEKWTANQVYTISSISEADTIFGSNYSYWADLVPMIRRAFTEWASVIKAISVWQPTMDVATAEAEWTLTWDSAAWASTITVADATIYTAWDVVYIGTWNTYTKEEKKIVDTAESTTVTFTTSLTYAHYIGETAKIVTVKADSDYTDAITAMQADESKSLVVSESNTVTVAAAITTMVENSTTLNWIPCVYVQGVEETDDAAAVIIKATTANSNRVIIPFPLLIDFDWNTVSGWESAAALAGAIVWNWLPKLNHNFTEFVWFWGVNSLGTDLDSLISGWITPIELKYGSIHIVRFITTSKTLNWVPDTTWREAAIRLNIDIIEKTIWDNIRSLYMQKGNTPQIRESIKQKIISLLDIFVGNDILLPDTTTNTPAYRDPIVTVDSEDDTKINIDIAVSPSKPLNFITLNFKISL